MNHHSSTNNLNNQHSNLNNQPSNLNPQHSSTNHLNNQPPNLNNQHSNLNNQPPNLNPQHSSINHLNNQHSNLNNQQINQIQQQPETQNHPPAHHAIGLNDGNPLNTSSCNANNQQKITTYENINKTKIVKIQNVPNLNDSILREHIVIIIPPTNIELMWNKKTFLYDKTVYYPIQYLDSVKINIERQDGSYVVKVTHFPRSKSELLLQVYNKLSSEFPSLEAKEEMNKKTAHNSVTPCLALLDGNQFIGQIKVDWWRKNKKSSNTTVHLETLEDKDDREMEILLKHCNGMNRESFTKWRKEKRYNVFSFMDEFSLSSMLGKIEARYQELAKKIQFNLTNVNRIVWYSQQKNGVYVLLSCAAPGGWCCTEGDYPPNILPPQIKFDTGSSNKKRKVGEGCHKLQVPPNLDVYVSDTDVDEAFYKQYETNYIHCEHIFSKGGLEKDAKFLMHWNYKYATVGWDEWKEIINTEAFKKENKATLTYSIGGLMKTETVEVRELVQRKKGERKGEEMEEEKEEEDKDENTGGEEDKGEEEKEEKKREEEEKQSEVQQCFDGFSGSSGYKTAKCVFWVVDSSSESSSGEEDEEVISGGEDEEVVRSEMNVSSGETASPNGSEEDEEEANETPGKLKDMGWKENSIEKEKAGEMGKMITDDTNTSSYSNSNSSSKQFKLSSSNTGGEEDKGEEEEEEKKELYIGTSFKAKVPRDKVRGDLKLKIVGGSDVKLVEQVGGHMYKGEWQDRPVAVKECDEQEAEKFLVEVEMLAQLKCEYIVQFLCTVLYPKPLLVMEWLEKGSLNQVIQNENPSWNTRLNFARQIALGMKYLHQHEPSILHRDLKSENIVVDANNTAKIVDFGVSKREIMNPLTKTIAAWRYAAPELLITNSRFSKKSDVYSYAMVLWEIVSGELVWKGCGVFKVIHKVVEKGERPEILTTYDKQYVTLLTKCWAQELELRPTFADIVLDLQNQANLLEIIS